LVRRQSQKKPLGASPLPFRRDYYCRMSGKTLMGHLEGQKEGLSWRKETLEVTFHYREITAKPGRGKRFQFRSWLLGNTRAHSFQGNWLHKKKSFLLLISKKRFKRDLLSKVSELKFLITFSISRQKGNFFPENNI